MCPTHLDASRRQYTPLRRLFLQHRLLKQAFENRLFLAPVTLAPGHRVLDSGTGAASWLLDLAEQVPPTVSFYGIDIGSRLFPSNPASNIHLSVNSVTKLPASWSSTFTLVHQRFLVLGLTLPDWQAAFKELYRILVPGGWINLLEPQLDVSRFSWTSGPATATIFTLACAVMLARGFVPDLPYSLPALLKEAGFVNIHTEERGTSLYGEDGTGMRENCHKGLLGLKTPVLDAGGMGSVKNEEEYHSLANAARKEWSETPEAVIQIFMVYAQKPASH